MLFRSVAVVAAASAVSTLLSGAGFPGIIPGQNMFGSSAGTMQSMLQRLGTGSSAISMLQTIANNPAKVLVNLSSQALVNGGNPIQNMYPGV